MEGPGPATNPSSDIVQCQQTFPIPRPPSTWIACVARSDSEPSQDSSETAQNVTSQGGESRSAEVRAPRRSDVGRRRFSHAADQDCQRTSPSVTVVVGERPTARATRSEARCPGYTWASTVTTPCSRSQLTIARAASEAYPFPWYAVPTTQATSAARPAGSGVVVACTYPTAWWSCLRRKIQLNQPCVPSGDRPATWWR